MSWRSKVLWSEGMLLQPQHFQQQERYRDHFIHTRITAMSPFGWGFVSLELDTAALATGTLALSRAVGIFPDGTPFDMPAVDPLPEPMELPADLRDERIFLALPLRRPGTQETNVESEDSLVRHHVAEEMIGDGNTAGEREALLQVGRLHTRFLRESEASDAWTTLGCVRVTERRSDLQITLDKAYIPPSLDVLQQPMLKSYTDELLGLLRQRGMALAARMTGTGAVSEVADFLLLQSVNRFQPVFAHLCSTSHLHPVHLFEHALALAGDLASFRDTRRAADFPSYEHDDLAACFTPLMIDLRRSLSMVMEQSAIQIPLLERKYGVRVAQINDVDLLRNAAFVLAVNAQMPSEAVRVRFPTQTKIGPVERLRDLVNLQLPGVLLQPMAVAPRQLPYHAGCTYFELQTRNDDQWKQLEQSGGLALHIAGEFPGLELSFWAIRS